MAADQLSAAASGSDAGLNGGRGDFRVPSSQLARASG